jgi:small subunit ribosomal protein S6
MIVEQPVRTCREYETIYILRPDTKEEDRKRVVERLDGVLDRLDGKILLRDDWGKRKLSYRINKAMQKFTHGYYFYIQYVGYSDLVAELERNLRLLDPVLKFLTVKLDEDIDREARIAADPQPKPSRRVLDSRPHSDDDDDDIPNLDGDDDDE